MKKSYFLAILLSMTLPVCATPIVPIENFAKTEQVPVWQNKLRRLNQGDDVKFRIVQLGDSHTAGGFLTDELRYQLQQRWGDGGFGVIHPALPAYQRNSLVSFGKNEWKVLSSRKDTADFPLGGVITQSGNGRDWTMSANVNVGEMQHMRLWLRPVSAKNALMLNDVMGNMLPIKQDVSYQWQTVDTDVMLPIRAHTEQGDVWEMGLIELENQKPKGVVVSALGINGAQLMNTEQRWRTEWLQDLAQTRADLVVLAYGTNEAFAGNVNTLELAQQWRNLLRRIHEMLPEAGILVVGAPESLKDKAGACGVRPPLLDAVQAMQRQVAQDEGVLFWSWQDAMGGACTMKQWLNKGLASKDGVHFSASGYRHIGAALADAVVALAQ